MSSELQEKISKYNKDLHEVLEKLHDAEWELKQKFDDEGLSNSENKRYRKIKAIIEKAEESLSLTTSCRFIEGTKNYLNNLTDAKLSKDEKIENINTILLGFDEITKSTESKLETAIEESDILDEDFLELSDLEKNTYLKVEITKLEKKIKEAEEKNWLDDDLKIELESLKKVQILLNSQIDTDLLEDDLIKASKEKTKAKKQEIVNKYITILNNIETISLEEIEQEIDESNILKEANKVLDNRNLLQKTKDKLAKKDDEEKKSSGKIKKIAKIVIIAGVIILVVKGCAHVLGNVDKTKNNKPGIEQDDNTKDNNELIEKLVNEYGIDKNIAIQYSNVEDFNIDYINDYEAARLKYNITAAEAVDYVNRAYEIQATNFYDEATIDQIVDVVRAINNKELFTSDNANLAQSFNTSFNRVVDNNLFGSTTEEDIKKIDALYEFAKEGSDLDNFLSGYADRVKTVLSNPSKEAKDEIYNYIATFALSLNGFTNTDPDFQVSEPYNTDAQVNDYFDWYMAYDSFIKPLYPTFVDEENFTKWEDLQIMMESVFHSPEIEAYMYEICGQTHTLGGK